MGTFWFATSALETRKRRSAKEALNSLLPGQNATPDEDDLIANFAAANGLKYHSLLDGVEYDLRLPSLVVSGSRESMVINQESPYFEIGNHGWRFMPGSGDDTPSRRGYIAIRHNLDLPRAVISSLVGQAGTLLAAATIAINVVGIFGEEGISERTPLEEFRRKATKIEGIDKSLRFYVHAEKTRVADVEALLTDEVRTHLTELAKSFDLELRGEWLFVYSSYGDLSTVDPEIWAWTFSALSRVLDVLALWGADVRVGRAGSWYTSEEYERPAKRDGVLRTMYGHAKKAHDARASTNPKPFLKHLESRDPHAAELARKLLKKRWELRTLWGPEQMDVWRLELEKDGWIVAFGIERGMSDGAMVARVPTDEETAPEFRQLTAAVIGWARATGADVPLTDPHWQALTLLVHGYEGLEWLQAGNDEAFVRISEAWRSKWSLTDLSGLALTARWVELIEEAAR